MYFFLFAIAGVVGIYIPNHYGRRDKIVDDLRKQVIRSLRLNGRFDERALNELVELGKQCSSGQEQELVLKALDDLVEKACRYAHYQAGMLEKVIDETVNILISRPHPEDFQSFRTAVELLQRIVTHDCTYGETENLVDHQRAVRALSALGGTVISQVGYSISVDYILMDFEKTLSLALLHHPELLTDVSQALFETGATALASKHYLFAVAAMRRLLSIFEENNPVPAEASTDTLGLLAHFWTAKDSPSSRRYAQDCLERIDLKGEALHSALEAARQHCQMTMEFETADKLTKMGKDLKVM